MYRVQYRCLPTNTHPLGDVTGEDPFLPDGLHYEFYAKRQLLVPSDEMVKSILDGGETVYAKVSFMLHLIARVQCSRMLGLGLRWRRVRIRLSRR